MLNPKQQDKLETIKANTEEQGCVEAEIVTQKQELKEIVNEIVERENTALSWPSKMLWKASKFFSYQR